jgi:hypothetical protein
MTHRCRISSLALAALLFAAGPTLATPPQVEDVSARQTGTYTLDATDARAPWRFDVSVSHPDSGWDHYADLWEVRDATGRVLGSRVLLHPHVEEQPFMRSLAGVNIPPGLSQVSVYARCSERDWSAPWVIELAR